MSVSSAMYAGITGLNAMGQAMAVISNNIANVNTIGFKSSRANFQDLLSQASHTASGSDQIGRGVALGAVTQIFSQGSFQNSSQDTDIAIAGEGFFQVADAITGEKLYTRAGNFIFDADGRLINPAGYILQGWEISANGDRMGTTDDVQMLTLNSDPSASSMAHFVSNLDASAESRTDGAHLSTVWDGTLAQPLDGNSYVYQTSLRLYDSLGNGHDLSVYFDPSDTTTNLWDYIICAEPTEDTRTDDGTSAGAAFSGTPHAGMLQRGTITFDPATGAIDASSANAITAEVISSIDPAIGSPVIGTWPSAGTINTQGTYTGTVPKTYTFTVTTSGTIGPPAGSPIIHWDDGTGNSGNITADQALGSWYPVGAEGVQVQFNNADVVTAGTDNFTVSATPYEATWASASPGADGYFSVDAAFLADPTTNDPVAQNVEINFGAKYGAGVWESDNLSTTQYASSSTTLFQTQNGYASGYLQRVSIDPDGYLTGTYSNGQNRQVFQIGLAIFRNQWGLLKIGNNLYAETRLSGQGTINVPGTGGTGTIAANALEQSNVDLAEEFVDMIVQQRGFQANSKVITTTDTMLGELIQLKR